jgi:hypothetical protein
MLSVKHFQPTATESIQHGESAMVPSIGSIETREIMEYAT